MKKDSVFLTRNFVKSKFMKNPHYSFDNWVVMYAHSLNVEKMAVKISKGTKCDRQVLSIGSLLHDIGKTYKTDKGTLHKHHEDFNLVVSENFLGTLGLDKKSLDKIKKIISYKSKSVEMRIIKDADAIAFYYDKRLNMLFLNWARRNRLGDAIERKLRKFDKLRFEASRKIGKPWFERMKKDWKINS